MAITTKAGTIHYDVPLTKYAVSYKSQLNEYIAASVLKELPVNKQSDKYYTFDKRDRTTVYDDIRTKRSKSRRIDNAKVSDDEYFCDEHALSSEIAWQDRINADSPYKENIMTIADLTDSIMLNKEIAAEALLFTAGNYGAQTLPPATIWDDSSNPDPRSDVTNAKQVIQINSGVVPNTIVMGKQVFDFLIDSVVVSNYLSDAADKNANKRKLAAFFDVENIIVGGATYNTAVEGLTFAGSYIWGKEFLVCYISPKSAHVKDPSLGYSFMWKGASINRNAIVGARQWQDPEIKADIFEVDMNYDYKMTFASAGFLLTTVIS